jgi:hypothetical protein
MPDGGTAQAPPSARTYLHRVNLSAYALFAFACCCGALGDGDPGVDAGMPEGCEPPPFGRARRVEITGWSGDAMEPFVTRDGRFLFFNTRDRPLPDDMDLHLADRVGDHAFAYRGPLAGANSRALDGVASTDDSGAFYFVSLRSYDDSLASVYRGRFEDGRVSGVELVPGISRSEMGWVSFDAEISPDGRTLVSVDGRWNPLTRFWSSADLFVAAKRGRTFARDRAATAQLDAINTSELEYAPALSRDGRLLLFTRLDPSTEMPRIHASVRRSGAEVFCPSVEVPAPDGFVEAPAFAPGEDAIYFHRLERERFVLYRMPLH